MPLNEILAPVYIKGKYATPVFPTGHAFRLYFATGCSFSVGASGDEENWRLHEGATDHGAVSGIVHEVFTRAVGTLPSGSSVTQIELYHSIPAAPNVLDHLNPLPSGNSYGSGAGVASAYQMWVFAGSLRPQWRFELFDGNNINPQKYAPYTPSSGDDNTMEWYILKSGIPFATNDGIRLTREVSRNVGYNRRLARSYGRSVAP